MDSNYEAHADTGEFEIKLLGGNHNVLGCWCSCGELLFCAKMLGFLKRWGNKSFSWALLEWLG